MLCHFYDTNVFLLSIWYHCKPFVNELSPSWRYPNCLRLDSGQWLYAVNFSLSVGINDCFTLPTQILSGFGIILCQIPKLCFTQIPKKSGTICENLCPHLFSWMLKLYVRLVQIAEMWWQMPYTNLDTYKTYTSRDQIWRSGSFVYQPPSSCLFGFHIEQWFKSVSVTEKFHHSELVLLKFNNVNTIFVKPSTHEHTILMKLSILMLF